MVRRSWEVYNPCTSAGGGGIMERVQYTQCTRCKGIFPDAIMTECVTQEDKWVSDLCPQCIEGWEFFQAFVEGNE